jgi:hypothetical protein
MIIQLQSSTAENTAAARRSLEAMVRGWGHEITQTLPDSASAARGSHGDERDRVIDPVSLTALVLAIPSAATAVLDLADRIRKRRRAEELIGHAKELAGQQVAVRVISRSRTVELSTLTPDQLLDLLSDEGHQDTTSLPQATAE